MAENRVKDEPKVESKETKGKGVFAGLEKRLKLETYFEDGFPIKTLPKILFALMIGLLYISNTHYADKATRQINSAQTEVEDLRADFTTLKSEMMFATKQSEVARRVKEMGLKESMKPPYKIVVEKGEY
jgi:hypothetical protein